MVHRFPDGQDSAQHIGVEFAVKLGLGHGLQRFECEDAGIVDQYVERTERRFGGLEQAAYVGRLRHIAVDGNGPAARVLDLGNDAVRIFPRRGVVDDHGGTGRRKTLGDAGADTLGGAGDDGDLAVQLAHQISPLSMMSGI
jgi:hypothetical protein